MQLMKHQLGHQTRFKEFQPKGEIKQPIWVADLTKNY